MNKQENAQHTATPWVVPALLSFDHSNKNSRGQPGLKLGTGEAGWTVYHFAMAKEALEFANALPMSSRMPAHDRCVAELTEVCAA